MDEDLYRQAVELLASPLPRKTWVSGCAQLFSKSQVTGYARVSGNLQVFGNPLVFDSSQVHQKSLKED